MIRTVTLIGAGRVASALGVALSNAGCTVSTVISRSGETARALAATLNAEWGSDPSVNVSSDLLVLAVNDSALEKLVSLINPQKETIVVHTAGSYPVEILDSLDGKRKGVFYPLQTFTKGRTIDFRNLPILVEASDSQTAAELEQLARIISTEVFNAGFEERRMIHLAAVFVCNFVNHLYSAGGEIAGRTTLPFTVLEPLMRETLAKAIEIGPAEAQTGPAARNDLNTIEKQLELLRSSPQLEKVYRVLTESIIKSRKD